MLEADVASASLATATKTDKPFVNKLRRRMNLHPKMTNESRELYSLTEIRGTRTSSKFPDYASLVRVYSG